MGTYQSGVELTECETAKITAFLKTLTGEYQGKPVSAIGAYAFQNCWRLEKVTLPDFYSKLSRSGCEIYQKKIGTKYPVGTRVRMIGADGFFALGEVQAFDGGLAIKPIRQF